MEYQISSRAPPLLIFLVVLLAHIGLLVGLIASRLRLTPAFPSEPLRLIFLPPSNSERIPIPAPTPASPTTAPFVPDIIPTGVVPDLPSLADAGRGNVDWVEEGHRVAEDITKKSGGTSDATKSHNALSSPSWFSAPQHHAGEQFKSDTGAWAVWINDYCYQISDPISIAGGSLGASLPRTVCPRASNTPRGDLFKELPEYKRRHPQE